MLKFSYPVPFFTILYSLNFQRMIHTDPFKFHERFYRWRGRETGGGKWGESFTHLWLWVKGPKDVSKIVSSVIHTPHPWLTRAVSFPITGNTMSNVDNVENIGGQIWLGAPCRRRVGGGSKVLRGGEDGRRLQGEEVQNCQSWLFYVAERAKNPCFQSFGLSYASKSSRIFITASPTWKRKERIPFFF